ncbi:MAG TPA: kynureninase [Flexivirga sp.]|uniref:kynureninase n=1 Tax=Flexivirga sp. TaxID=1962927 RepID=UPI002C73BA23|nr:kynureninase [Flexivirga sp.]HWC21703.1 kynureninase [Flexivirga sp.]
MTDLDRTHCERLDAHDELAPLRDRFVVPDGVTYLVGNSLGAMLKDVPERLHRTVTEEWAQGLVGSWNAAGWFDKPLTVGDRLAPLVGAGPGQLVVGDSTSVNLFKVAGSALRLRPQRSVVIAESGSFPTDLYMLQGLVGWTGQHRLELTDSAGPSLDDLLSDDVAAVVLSHVDYRTGELLDMPSITRRVHDAGALMIWDLCHSVGALDIDLPGSEVDFAIGCTYKYLNGGPGSPAFAYVAPGLQDDAVQPLSGWHGHAAPFAFTTDYEPAEGISRFRTSTPHILSYTPLEVSLDMFEQLDMSAVRGKSQALSELFITLVEQECAGFDLSLVSPREAARRGSQVSLRHPRAYQVVRALMDHGVHGDFRAPDVMRFGFTPLYLRFVDVWDAVAALREVFAGGEWQSQPEPSVTAVT